MPSAKHILLVDGDAVTRRSLADQLAREGAYVVIEAASVAEAQAVALPYDGAILDAALPDGDGAGLARTLRKAGFGGFILFLTDAEDVAGLAGEHLVKPFRLHTLLARLNAHLGRHGAAADDEGVRIGPYRFQPGAKLLTDGAGRKIRLTEKETNILRFLHAAEDKVARETLLHEVWGYSPAVATHTLETHIYRLRRKIERHPGADPIVITEEGGYRLAR